MTVAWVDVIESVQTRCVHKNCITMSALCVLPLALGAFTPAPVRHAVAGRHASPCMMAEPLRTFLEQKAQVAPKFVDRVLEICDEEMIGEVSQLEIAQKAGLLPKVRPSKSPAAGL